MKYWIALLALLFATTAQAEWHEASSDHFIIYADDSQKDVERFANNLESFHAALEFMLNRDLPTPSPSNRVMIFAVGNQRDIRKLAGSKSRNVAGFYIPRAGASRAFVQDIRLKNGYPSFSTVILLHEYVHHFIISSSNFAMPRWMSEGSAECFAAATFNKDGSVTLGRPAQHRAGELAYARDVSIEELFDHELYKKRRGKSRRYDAFYGQSWLLYHYLTFSEERRGQLGQYQRAMRAGQSSIEAARSVFGDIAALQKETDAYLRQRRMYQFVIPPDKLKLGSPVSVRKLSKGEAAMIEVQIQSQRGVTQDEALELLPKAREIAAKYPEEAAVMAALAEAEHDAGNDAESIAAADKAIALNPKLTNPYVQKGYSLFRIAEEADPEDRAAAYKAAMKPFEALNAIENDHPLPLIYYYRSFAAQGKFPPDNAMHALERASQLAPFDKGLKLNVAMMQMSEGKYALAAQTLRPLAADPHNSGASQQAQRLIETLKEKAKEEAEETEEAG